MAGRRYGKHDSIRHHAHIIYAGDFNCTEAMKLLPDDGFGQPQYGVAAGSMSRSVEPVEQFVGF